MYEQDYLNVVTGTLRCVVVVGGGIIPKTQVATAQVGLFCFLLVPRHLPGIYLFLSLSLSHITVLTLIAGLTYSSSAGNGEVQHYPSLQRLDTGARGRLCSNCRQGQKCAPRGRSRSALDHCSPRQPLHQQQQQAAASSRSSWRWRSDEDSLSLCACALPLPLPLPPRLATPRHAMPYQPSCALYASLETPHVRSSVATGWSGSCSGITIIDP